jgi:dedicator of cytokinesis protein 3
MTGDDTATVSSSEQQYGILTAPKQPNDVIYIMDRKGEYYECLQCMTATGNFSPALLILPKTCVKLADERLALHSADLYKCLPLVEKTSADSLVNILACAMRDWVPLMQELVSKGQLVLQKELGELVDDLTKKTKFLLSKSLTQAEEIRIRNDIIAGLFTMNQNFGLPTLLFEGGRQVPELPPIKLLDRYLNDHHSEKSSEFRRIEFQFQAFVGTFCKQGEQLELQFCIYNSSSGEPISETLTIVLNSNGMPIDDSQVVSCIFEDIDISKTHIYLLARVVVVSTVSHQGPKSDLLRAVRKKLSKNNLSQQEDKFVVRQPVGYALYPLTETAKLMESIETSVSIALLPENSDGREWSRPSTAFLPSMSERIAFRLKAAMTGHELEEALSIPTSGLPRLTTPPKEANKMYITLQNGRFNAPKSNGFSCEVTCQIRFANGSFANEGIMISETITSLNEFKSVVIPNCIDPYWNDTFQLTLAPTELTSAHLFFTFKNAGKGQEGKIFAFGFMPLVQSKNVILNDGLHELTLYKYDEKLAHPSNYLSYPAGPNLLVPVHLSLSSVTSMASAAQATSKLPAMGHSVFVQSRLFSTIFSQDVNLVNFVQWKRTDSVSRIPLRDVILNIQNVGEIDMATMGTAIFAAFVDLFFEMGPDLYATLFDIVLPIKTEVMDSFIVFLSTVMDSKFSKSKEKVIDQLMQKDLYRSQLPMLTNLFCKTIDDASTPESGKTFRRMVKVWNYILRMVIIACKDDVLRSFESCQAVFTSLQQFLLATPTPQLLASQTIAIQYLDALLEELSVFDEEERFSLLLDTLRCINLEATGLRTHFLKLLNRLVVSQQFSSTKLSAKFFTSVLTWTFECYKKESFSSNSNGGIMMELCVEVLNSCLGTIKGFTEELQRDVKEAIPKELWAELLLFSLKNQFHSRSSSLETEINGTKSNTLSYGTSN